jgi:hypothetical protein
LDELQLLLKKVTEYREQLKEYLAAGSVKNHDDYRQIVGRLEAFNVVEDDLRELIDRHVSS